MDSSMLERYRSDRHKLLEFLLSSDFIKRIHTPSGSTISTSDLNLDDVSVDHVLESLQSGGQLDVSVASKKHRDELNLPIMIYTKQQHLFYCLTNLDSAGPPPEREPPPALVNPSYYKSRPSPPSGSSVQRNSSTIDKSVDKHISITSEVLEPVSNMHYLALGLPTLQTGLSDDDLRQSAYEVLLACMVPSRFEVSKDRRKEKTSRFLAGLKNRKDKSYPQPQFSEIHLQLIDTIRIQMEISEAMDTLIRQRLMQLDLGKVRGHIGIPQIATELLSGTCKSHFQNVKQYLQCKNRQANVVEELISSPDYVTSQKEKVGVLLAKIRQLEDWDVKMSSSERSEVLSAIRQITLSSSVVPSTFIVPSETFYPSIGYHLKIRLYEKLLSSVFDILEDGQIIEETDKILNLIKMTWSMLGITQKLHDTLFLWVIFQQFIRIEDAVLLDYAIQLVQKVLLAKESHSKEEEYIERLQCFRAFDGCETAINIMESVLLSIRLWCNGKLHDYDLHFSKKPCLFKSVMIMGLAVSNHNSGSHGTIKFAESEVSVSHEFAAKKVRTIVERSVDAAFRRANDAINFGYKVEKVHPLARLATELGLIAERELNTYYPVTRNWCPEAGMVSSLKLHQLYGEQLKPFLKDVSCLSEDVRLVLPAADMLESRLMELWSSACHQDGLQFPFSPEFECYQISEVSRPIILDWVIAQHERILEWTGRASYLEVWEPLSNQQKQAASAVEVFRIIEETVDQFFNLSLPMDITHLQALLSIIFHSLDAYLRKMDEQLVAQDCLYPSAPSLTRYKETAFQVTKKKLAEAVILDEEVNRKLNDLTTPKLCVRLNTAQYIQRQVSILRDGIRESWASMRRFVNSKFSNLNFSETSDNVENESNESVDELFIATFDCIRDSAAISIRRICNLIGTRVVFWDLSGSFLKRLYHGGVGSTRFDSTLPHFDSVLNRVCAFVDDSLRDLVVSSICAASLEGYVWVLLEGGPSRAFSDSDVILLEDDLNMLKDFFVADGEGLPRSFVEEQAKFAHQVLRLFSLQAESVIQMLMASSTHIKVGSNVHRNDNRCLEDAHTLIRVLCHKKDREASKFLKRHYQLPASSEYEESTAEGFSSKSPIMADLLKRSASFRWADKRSASFRWADKGHSSLRSLRKKLQEATAERKHGAR